MRNAHSIEGLPDCDGEVTAYAVGRKYSRLVRTDEHPHGRFRGFGPVTRIEVAEDLPGLHCNMERVRVFAGDDLVFEAPVASLGGIHYFPDNQ